MKPTDLRRPMDAEFADQLYRIRRLAQRRLTGAPGVTVLGPTGDVRWPDAEAPSGERSVREVSDYVAAHEEAVTQLVEDLEAANDLIADTSAAAAAEAQQIRDDLEAATGPAAPLTLQAQDAFNQAVAAWDKALASAQAGGNLVLNGGFEQVNAAGNPVEWQAPTSWLTYPETGSRSGTRHMRLAPSSPAGTYGEREFPASTGRSYYLEGHVKASALTDPDTVQVGLALRVRTAAGVLAWMYARVAPSTLSTTAWTRVSGTVTVSTADVVEATIGPHVSGGGMTGVAYLFDDLLAVDVTEAEAARLSAQLAVDEASAAKTAAASAITQTVIQYAIGPSSTTPPTSGWTASATSPTASLPWAWMRSVVTYGDNTTATSSAVLVTGASGPKGDAGTSVSIKGRVATSSALPNSGVVDGDGYITEDTGHLWVHAGGTWVDAGLIRGPQGDPGMPGVDGVSITGVTSWYRTTAVNASAPAQPSGTGNPAGWSTVEPDYVAGTALWRADRIMLSNGTAVWTTVTKVAAYTAAATAIDSANGRNSVTHSTLAPSGSTNAKTGLPNVEGDVWWRWDSTTTRNVIGQWFWIGGAWVASAINHEVISSVDVNKLVVTGSAKISQAVIDKLWADVVLSRKIITDMLVVTGSNRLPSGPADTWPFQRVTASTSALNTEMNPTADTLDYTVKSHQYVTSTVAQGPSYANVLILWDQAANQYVPIEPGVRMRASIRVRAGGTYPEGLPRVRLAFWWRGADGASVGSLGGPNQALTWTWDELVMEGTAPVNAVGMYVTVQTNGPGVIRVGVPSLLPMDAGNLLVDGAVTATHITASESLSAKVAAFLELSAGKITSGELNATTNINVGSNLSLDGTNGIRFWAPDPDNPSQQISMGGFGTGGSGDFWGITDGSGRVIASLGSAGANFPAGRFDELVVGGRDLTEILDPLPRGIIAFGERTTQGADTSAEAGFLSVQTTLMPGRMYRIAVLPHFVTSGLAGTRYVGRLRWAPYPDESVSTSSDAIARGRVVLGVGAAAEQFSLERLYSLPGTTPYECQILYTYATENNQAFPIPTADQPVQLIVEDIGPATPSTARIWDNPTPSQPPAAQQETRYTSEWVCTDSVTYRGTNNSQRPKSDGIQQSHPGQMNGAMYGYALFNGGAVSGEVGKTLAAALPAGVVIESVKVRMHAEFWYYYAGGTALIRPHALTSLPTTGTPPTGTLTTVANWPRPGTKTVTVDGFLRTHRGIAVGPGSTATNYGRFAGHLAAADLRPRLIITYRRVG